MKRAQLRRLIFVGMGLIFVVIPHKSHAQVFSLDRFGSHSHSEDLPVNMISLPSAQDWTFMKYGDLPVDPYTGSVSVNIPFYVYKDTDFEIPISFVYGSDGYKPGVPTDIMGMGWALSAGGTVTREIRGAADDMHGEYQVNGNWSASKLRGFYYYYSSNTSYPINFIGAEWAAAQMTYLTNQWWNPSDLYYETLSDLYTFKFGNHSGNFVLSKEGTTPKVKVFNSNGPAGEYKVELFDVPGRDMDGIIGIVITTGDGYRYTFGGTDETLYHSRPGNNSSLSNIDDYMYNPYQSLAWPLTEIKAPNGRIAKFNYHNRRTEIGKEAPDYETMMMVETGNGLSPLYLDELTGETYLRFNKPSQYVQNSAQSYVRSRLVSIEIKENDYAQTTFADIQFQYGEKTGEKLYRPIRQNTSYRYNLHNYKRLEKVSVRKKKGNSFEVLKSADITYTYENKANIMFLQEIAISGEGSHKFVYNSPRDFPLYTTSSMDSWSYYNDIEGEPRYNTNNTNLFDQEPHLEPTKKGVLQRIIYPTGGYTEFEYELHDFSKTLARYQSDKRLIFLKDCAKETAGGLRVKKITDYSEAGKIHRSKEYIYEKNGKSTGISLTFPRYYSGLQPLNSSGTVSAQANSQQPDINSYSFPSNYHNFTMDRAHVEYSSVVERHLDGSTVEYSFSNYTNMSDISVLPSYCHTRLSEGFIRITWYDSGGLPHTENVVPLVKNFEQKPYSRHLYRGKLLSKKYFDAEGNPLSAERYIYDFDKPLAYDEGLEINRWFRYNFRTYTSGYNLTAVQNVQYYETDSVMTEVRNYYNDLGQVIKRETSNSDGSIVTQSTMYVGDMNTTYQTSATQSIYAENNNLKRYNMLSYPVKEQTTVKRPASAPVLVSGNMYEYRCTTAPSDRSVGTLKALYTAEAPSQTSIYNDFDYDRYLKPQINYFYDYYTGSPVESTDRNGVKTCYIWGYRGKYLCAKVENMDYNGLYEAIGIDLRYDYIEGDLSWEIKNKLLNLPNARVYIYEYIPLIGLAREIAPNSTSTYYRYDQHGRLYRTLDNWQYVLNEFQYNFKH